MKLYSTNDKTNIVNLREATLNSLPKDKGLFLPCEIPKLSKSFFENLKAFSLPEIAFEVSRNLIGNEIEKNALESICTNAINFPAPLNHLGDNKYILELFHGPSLAFKDFGARFMAQLMSHFIKDEDKKLTILVATSGDTGGAVAAGFHNVKNIEVIILYPSGKVSPLQEKQLTTWGDNIHAVEWKGTFDDCQAVVKRAFLDPILKEKYNLSSANSINISRLIPQSFYYFEAIKQIRNSKPTSISVPSGNIGNISAGSLARNMGLPIAQLIAAHNANNTVTEYYKTGDYNPKPSVSTLSNAMDVGNPSNFPRFQILNGSTWNSLKESTLCYSYNDHETTESLRKIKSKYNYISEPHAAIAYRGLEEKEIDPNHNHIFMGTAHPAKFLEIVEEKLDIDIKLPKVLEELSSLQKEAVMMDNSYNDFVQYLLDR
ncbi:threonine synthase [Saprospiraceae bacterium]|nr:threonine synthase [Saprospiraceae bacterium]